MRLHTLGVSALTTKVHKVKKQLSSSWKESSSCAMKKYFLLTGETLSQAFQTFQTKKRKCGRLVSFSICFSKGLLSSIMLRFPSLVWRNVPLNYAPETSLLEILPLASWNSSMKFKGDIYLTPNVILMKTLFLIPWTLPFLFSCHALWERKTSTDVGLTSTGKHQDNPALIVSQELGQPHKDVHYAPFSGMVLRTSPLWRIIVKTGNASTLSLWQKNKNVNHRKNREYYGFCKSKEENRINNHLRSREGEAGDCFYTIKESEWLCPAGSTWGVWKWAPTIRV